MAVLAALAVWAADTRVDAYIDPGSGALVWQAILAAIAGAAFYFRGFLGRLFSRDRRQDPPAGHG